MSIFAMAPECPLSLYPGSPRWGTVQAFTALGGVPQTIVLERKLKGLVLPLTHWVWTSTTSLSRSNPA